MRPAYTRGKLPVCWSSQKSESDTELFVHLLLRGYSIDAPLKFCRLMRNEDFGKYTLMPPRCPSCALIMRLVRASRFGDDLYIHYVFECRACGVAHVDAVEIEAA